MSRYVLTCLRWGDNVASRRYAFSYDRDQQHCPSWSPSRSQQAVQRRDDQKDAVLMLQGERVLPEKMAAEKGVTGVANPTRSPTRPGCHAPASRATPALPGPCRSPMEPRTRIHSALPVRSEDPCALEPASIRKCRNAPCLVSRGWHHSPGESHFWSIASSGSP